MPTVYWLPVAASVLQWQSQELQQTAYSLQSFKIFTVWPFEEKCANTSAGAVSLFSTTQKIIPETSAHLIQALSLTQNIS